ncbi:hypothetical protein OROGR_000989 [Orobanche gracilis]
MASRSALIFLFTMMIFTVQFVEIKIEARHLQDTDALDAVAASSALEDSARCGGFRHRHGCKRHRRLAYIPQPLNHLE